MKGTIKSSDRITLLFERGSRYKSVGFLALYEPVSLSEAGFINEEAPTSQNYGSEANNNATSTQQRNSREGVSPKSSSVSPGEIRERDTDKRGKLAFIAGKKLGSAPLRSKAKRLLREAAKEAGAPWKGYDVALIARPRLLTRKYALLVEDLIAFTQFLENKNDGKKGGQSKEEGLPAAENPAARPEKESEALSPPVQPATPSESSEGIERAEKGHEEERKKEKPKLLQIGIGIPRMIALSCIKVYRHAISPLLPPSCRYVPTCSEYALIAFERFGFWRGLWLSVKRVGRCHPFVEGGFDPVPERFTF